VSGADAAIPRPFLPAAAREGLGARLRGWTAVGTTAVVPELRLWLSGDLHATWAAMEAAFGLVDSPPPFWCVAWPGSQALARFLLDTPGWASGKRVLDFASGCGLAGLAAARAGAAAVLCADLDPAAGAIAHENARLNGLSIETTEADLVAGEGPAGPWDLVLAGDATYDTEPARQIRAFLAAQAAAGATVLLGDPGRPGGPVTGIERLAWVEVPTELRIEGMRAKRTGVYRFTG
jgi:predicted nicotinamide N-methyase